MYDLFRGPPRAKRVRTLDGMVGRGRILGPFCTGLFLIFSFLFVLGVGGWEGSGTRDKHGLMRVDGRGGRILKGRAEGKGTLQTHAKPR